MTRPRPLIRLDWSAYSTLAICRACDWRAAAWDRPAAWLLAAEHVNQAHGDGKQAARCRDAAWQADRRTAAAEQAAVDDIADDVAALVDATTPPASTE